MSNDAFNRGIFSEQKGVLDDAFQNATGVEHATGDLKEGIRENVEMGGVRLMSDCNYCGLQWRGIVKWPEIAGFFTGQQVPGTQAIRPGVASAFGCRKCNSVNKFLMPWADINRYVAMGVEMGALPRDIYKVREQIMAQRAAQRSARGR